ncbi:unnamed protein product [Orchesella dallaii]|uniref:Uncharacterized protein n=1 Tax=Orchesella dallaii TaxID=48710 RepID=A0ABP1QBY9_9HEXA
MSVGQLATRSPLVIEHPLKERKQSKLSKHDPGNVVNGNENTTTQNLDRMEMPSCNDKWSKRGVSSAVSISVLNDGEECNIGRFTISIVDEEEKENAKSCLPLRKLVGNFILPGILGIERYRIVRKMHWKVNKAQELISNTIYFSSRIHGFLHNLLLPDIKSLATKMYFPVGQIEADGLSVMSAEVWAATYLLLGTHKNIREADFNDIRSAYANLAWDSGKVYRANVEFSEQLHAFRNKILPLWNEIERIVGLKKGDFEEIDASNQFLNSKKPLDLPTIRINEDFPLINTLDAQVTPEKSMVDIESQNEFRNMEYGKKIEIIMSLLEKPGDTLKNGFATLVRSGNMLESEKVCIASNGVDKDLTCTRAIKILAATLKMLCEEVKLPSGLRYDVVEWIRCVSDDLNSYFSYAEWVVSKFSEFQSMLKLCYNFALICYDLDLPNFDVILKKEKGSQSIIKLNSENGEKEEGSLDYKVVSLTRLMLDVSNTVVSTAHESMVDDDFDWMNFYKTDYHVILQRLPLRVGIDLLQFRIRPDVKTLRRREGAHPAKPGNYMPGKELLQR